MLASSTSMQFEIGRPAWPASAFGRYVEVEADLADVGRWVIEGDSRISIYLRERTATAV
jgi:hypothetical protein